MIIYNITDRQPTTISTTRYFGYTSTTSYSMTTKDFRDIA